MKTTTLAAFASQLQAWRQQKNWTQVEAAGTLGYSVTAGHLRLESRMCLLSQVLGQVTG